MENNIYSKFLGGENNTHKQNKSQKTFKKLLKENISEEAEKKLNDYKKKLENSGYKVKSSKVEKGGSVYGSPKYNLYLDFVLDKDITKEEFAKIVDVYKSSVKIYDEEDNEVESGKEVRLRYRENIGEKTCKRSIKNKKLNESVLEDKLEKVYDVLDGFNIKYYDNVETSHHEQDGEEWYDYLGVFEFDEEIEEKVMKWVARELEKELKYSEVYPNEGDECYQGFTITLGSGDEDDLFESKNLKLDEEKYDVETLKNNIDKELKNFGYKIANYQKDLTKYGTFRFELDKLPSKEECEKIRNVLTKFAKNKEKIEVGCNSITGRCHVQVEHFNPDKKVNENVYDIEHLVLFPDNLTDEEEYSRMILLGTIGDISELTDSMGDIYITSMKETPEDKNEPYNSKTRVSITFEGDDVNVENLEKIATFINSETNFEMIEIENDNEISFDFDPKYV